MSPQEVQTLYAEGQREWPALELEFARFFEYLRARVTSKELPSARDLYVACGGWLGLPSALEAFDRHYLTPASTAARRYDSSDAFVDEVKQRVRQKLFVQPGAKIGDYSGKGTLIAWVRVVTSREAQNLLRERKPQVSVDEQRLSLRAEGPDPEAQVLKQRGHEELRQAFEKSLQGMADRQRNLLRLHYLDGLTSDAIAKMYGVTGSRVRQWIKQAKLGILEETRRLLGERLHLEALELESMIGDLRSQFDVSISRMLKR